ncbi:hypothetical protein AS156_16540 [Bradyrhizobium macuxiense]|uniref:Uncharacterized protein n=1 Tax=Bradyrhizobium macuxiense TaxID=1755647 RepID=A0A109JHJ0_9BRAD|nr:hypothetical protein AS156_16540 [Bradyrhizobium macuxiense]
MPRGRHWLDPTTVEPAPGLDWMVSTPETRPYSFGSTGGRIDGLLATNAERPGTRMMRGCVAR